MIQLLVCWLVLMYGRDYNLFVDLIGKFCSVELQFSEVELYVWIECSGIHDMIAVF